MTSDPKNPQGDPSHKSSLALNPTQPDPNPSAKKTSIPSAIEDPDISTATPQRVEPSSGDHVGSPINSAAGVASVPPASTNLPGKGNTQGVLDSQNSAILSGSGGESIGEATGNDPQVQVSTDKGSVVATGSTQRAPIAGFTIPVGSQATVVGHVISLFTSSGAVYGSVYALPSIGRAGSPSNTLADPLLFAGQSIVRASSGGLIIGSSTVVPGSSLIISGHTISAGSSTAFIDGGAYALPSSVGEVLHQSSNAQVTAAPNGDGILSAGGSPVTLSGTVYSMLSDGGIVARCPSR